jgi:hypothetical protein
LPASRRVRALVISAEQQDHALAVDAKEHAQKDVASTTFRTGLDTGSAGDRCLVVSDAELKEAMAERFPELALTDVGASDGQDELYCCDQRGALVGRKPLDERPRWLPTLIILKELDVPRHLSTVGVATRR